MRALMLGDSGPVVRTDHEMQPRAGEARIALRLGGICATDLELVRGYMGFRGVLGHEFVGEVIEGPSDLRGQRVVGEINCACGVCAICRAGRPTHCSQRTVLGIDGRDGAFSESFSLPIANLHVVPDNVSDEAAVFVEPLAAALQILEQVHVAPSHRVVVLGVGRLGQLVARVAALTGAEVTAVSRNEARLSLLPAGIMRALSADAGSLRGADLVIDCTGSADGLSLATALVRPRGTIVLKTTVHDSRGVTPIPWVIDEITLVGSRCGPFAPALRLLASGVIDPGPLVSARYPLSEGLDALRAAASPGAVKVLVTPDPGAR